MPETSSAQTSAQPSVGKVEVLKVWYSVFCTLADAHAKGEYTDGEFIKKIMDLRKHLAQAVPEVEAEMARHKQ